MDTCLLMKRVIIKIENLHIGNSRVSNWIPKLKIRDFFFSNFQAPNSKLLSSMHLHNAFQNNGLRKMDVKAP